MDARLELLSEYNAVANATADHPATCLCEMCRRFCDLSDVLVSSGDPRVCVRGVCDD